METVNFVCNTDGSGYWSSKKKQVRCVGLELSYYNEDKSFGELRVFFDCDTWNVHQDGLIYTDALFEKELTQELNKFGLYGYDISYSEQGMQGDNFVSLDVGKDFIQSWYEVFEHSE